MKNKPSFNKANTRIYLLSINIFLLFSCKEKERDPEEYQHHNTRANTGTENIENQYNKNEISQEINIEEPLPQPSNMEENIISNPEIETEPLPLPEINDNPPKREEELKQDEKIINTDGEEYDQEENIINNEEEELETETANQQPKIEEYPIPSDSDKMTKSDSRYQQIFNEKDLYIKFEEVAPSYNKLIKWIDENINRVQVHFLRSLVKTMFRTTPIDSSTDSCMITRESFNIKINDLQYQIVKKIGQGEKGAVYMIKGLDYKKYVLKVNIKRNNAEFENENTMHKVLYEDDGLRKYTVRANLVIYKNRTYFKTTNDYMIIKEFVKGKTLTSLIEEDKINCKKIKQIVENKANQLIKALKHYLNFIIAISRVKILIADAHGANMIVPENEDTIKIIDGEYIKISENNIGIDFLVENIQNVSKKWPWKAKRYKNLLIGHLRNTSSYKIEIVDDKMGSKKNQPRDSAILWATSKIRENKSLIPEDTKPGKWMPSHVAPDTEKVLRAFKAILGALQLKYFGEQAEKYPESLFEDFVMQCFDFEKKLENMNM